MSSRPASTGKAAKKSAIEPRPSASILLISPSNEILLLHRVRTSSAFPSAHVFPGGNLSAVQDGDIPAPEDKNRHQDGEAYRMGAIRECFEESGILLAKKRAGEGEGLLDLADAVREQGRKDVHSGKVRFGDWVTEQGGVIDTGTFSLCYPLLYSSNSHLTQKH
jgi:8-oxo-dGTP pyrophosphatase MutT (NUDIX family)